MTDFRALCAELADWIHEETRTSSGVSDPLVARARAAMEALPEPQELTDQEIEEWADAAAEVPLEEMDPEVHGWRRCFTSAEFCETIRAALARWGRPAIEPVPGVEGKP
jgi:hypothetical protein